MGEKNTFWVAKDIEENEYKPMAFITIAFGNMAKYVQPDIDKFLKKNPNLKIVKVRLEEIKS